jgi:predicted O-methyltransferase YrrM
VTADQLPSRALRRFVLVAVIIPLALVAVGVTIQLVVLPHVPSTIAVHWDAAGVPDRFAPAWTQPLATILFGAGVPLLIAMTSLPGLRRGDRGVTYRFLGSVAAGSAALLTTVLTWTFVMQAGASPDAAIGPIWPALVGCMAVGAGAGIAGWFLQPKEEWSRAETPAAKPLVIAPGEHVVWLRTASMTRGAAIGIAVAVLAVAVAAVVSWLTGAPEGVVWLLGGAALLLLVLAATTVAFHVRVDEAGLSVDSVLGIEGRRRSDGRVRRMGSATERRPEVRRGAQGGGGHRNDPREWEALRRDGRRRRDRRRTAGGADRGPTRPSRPPVAVAPLTRLACGMRSPTPIPTPESWRRVDAYLTETLVGHDHDLETAVAEQHAAGLPAIEVAPVAGKLLHLLARISGARRVLEIGTLGAYSTIWMARGIPDGGHVVTIEAEPRTAEIARANLDRAGVGDKVEILLGRAADVLPTLEGSEPFDLVFIDADKESNTIYIDWAARLGRSGTVVVVDNVGRGGEVANPATTDPMVIGTQRGLELLGRDPRFEATALRTLDLKGYDGIAIAVVV